MARSHTNDRKALFIGAVIVFGGLQFQADKVRGTSGWALSALEQSLNNIRA